MKKEDIQSELLNLVISTAEKEGYDPETVDLIRALIQSMLKGGSLTNSDLRDRLRGIGGVE